jgi:hypothetical protein
VLSEVLGFKFGKISIPTEMDEIRSIPAEFWIDLFEICISKLVLDTPEMDEFRRNSEHLAQIPEPWCLARISDCYL